MSAARIIFSDVDGTFLDAHYLVPFSDEFLRRVFGREHVVFVSSRTLSELSDLAAQIGASPDLIGENGAFVATHDEAVAAELEAQGALRTPSHGVHVASLAAPRTVTRHRVRDALHRAGSSAVLADELPPRRFAELSGYDVISAGRAVHREYSVLLKGADPMVASRLRASGLDATFGGRWVTVIAGSNKGRAVRAYRSAWEKVHGPVHTIGVGDSPGDETLLRTVDRAFVIQQPVLGYAPELAAVPRAHRLTHPGPYGWEEMITILEEEDAYA